MSKKKTNLRNKLIVLVGILFLFLSVGLIIANQKQDAYSLSYQEVEYDYLISNDYAFTPRWIEGKTIAQSSPAYNSLPQDTETAYAGGRIVSEGMDYQSIWSYYSNVGTFKGKTIDMKVTLQNAEFDQCATNKFILLFGQDARHNGQQVILNIDNLFFGACGANSKAYYKYQFYDHETKNEINIKTVITYGDLDQGESMAIENSTAQAALVKKFAEQHLDVSQHNGYTVFTGNEKHTCTRADGASGQTGECGGICDDCFDAGLLTTLNNGSFTVGWSGAGMGISTFGFLRIEDIDPVKTVDKTSANEGDQLTYSISQYVPNQNPEHYYTTWEIHDYIPDITTSPSNVSVINTEGRNVTGFFNISVTDNNLVVSAKPEVLSNYKFGTTDYFYNMTYKIIVTGTITEGNSATTIANKAKFITNFNTTGKDSNEVTTTVTRKPSVTATYKTLGGDDLTSAVVQKIATGQNYSTEQKSFDNYRLLSVPNNANGVMPNTNVTVEYVYVEQPTLTVTPEITNITETGISNKITVTNTSGFATCGTVVTIPIDGNITNVKDIVITPNIGTSSISGNNLIITLTSQLTAQNNLVITYNGDLDVSGAGTNKVNLDPKVTYYPASKTSCPDKLHTDEFKKETTGHTEKTIPATVTANYYDYGSNEKLTTSVSQNYTKGDTYQTEQKSFTGYKFIKVDGNKTGTAVGNIVVNYYYIEDPVLTVTPEIPSITPTGISNKITVTNTSNFATCGTIVTIPVDINIASVKDIVITPNIGTAKVEGKNIVVTLTSQLTAKNNLVITYNGDLDVSGAGTNKVNLDPIVTYYPASKTSCPDQLHTDEFKKETTGHTEKIIPAKVTTKFQEYITKETLSEDVVDNYTKLDNYTTTAKQIEGYKLVETPANANGVAVGEKVVTYYYVEDPIIEVNADITRNEEGGYIDQTVTMKNITRFNSCGVSMVIPIDERLTNIREITMTPVDSASYVVKNNKIYITFLESFKADEDFKITYKTDEMKGKGGNVINLDPVVTYYPGSKDVCPDVLHTDQFKKTATDHDEEKIPVVITVHHYIEGSTTKVGEDEIINTFKGEEYTTNPIKSEDYTAVIVPANANGIAKEEEFEVIYEYNATHVKIGEIKLFKSSETPKITNVNQVVDYKIAYNGTVEMYKGKAELTIIDKLPYEINEDLSDIGDGVYDSKTKTITWKETYSDIDTYNNGTYDISYEKYINLVFKNYDLAAEYLTNVTESTLYFEETDEDIIRNAQKDIPVEIPGEPVNVVPVDNDGNEIPELPTEKQCEGMFYGRMCEVSCKVYDGYNLVTDSIENYQITDKEQERKCVYKKVNNPYTGEGLTLPGYIVITLGALSVVGASVYFFQKRKVKVTK